MAYKFDLYTNSQFVDCSIRLFDRVMLICSTATKTNEGARR